MITSKQRAYLRALAHDLEPTVYIGRQGLTENIIKEMETGFEVRELVKVKIQEGCELDPKETANKIAERTGAEFVQAIGRKFVLYRESSDNKTIELPKPKKGDM
ncbi:MAG: ribosome assembly RNA-binding protein YhbY [Clostridia bacterium]|nr:ribosome assembly RNA-binding protein YhbY [Clostridia bacterium]